MEAHPPRPLFREISSCEPNRTLDFHFRNFAGRFLTFGVCMFPETLGQGGVHQIRRSDHLIGFPKRGAVRCGNDPPHPLDNVTTLWDSPQIIDWLVVEPTHLKNISQNGNLPELGVKNIFETTHLDWLLMVNKNWLHYPVILFSIGLPRRDPAKELKGQRKMLLRSCW